MQRRREFDVAPFSPENRERFRFSPRLSTQRLFVSFNFAFPLPSIVRSQPETNAPIYFFLASLYPVRRQKMIAKNERQVLATHGEQFVRQIRSGTKLVFFFFFAIAKRKPGVIRR
ncbi:unnamed protein product [Ixodes persulcatus]